MSIRTEAMLPCTGVQVLGPETTAYLVAALNPPGVCARGLSRVLLKAVQGPAPVPLFVAQRAEDVIKGGFPFTF